MISVKPTTPAFAVLEMVVRLPGELDAEAIAAHLWPPPKLTAPLTTGEAWKARAEAVATHRREKAAKVARLLGQLVDAGYVERTGPPRVARWFLDRVARWDRCEALRRAHPSWPRSVGNLGGHLSLLRKVEEGPPSVRALLGENPSGAVKRDYADLCMWGVVVPPSFRVPTAAGVALVESVREVAA